MTEKMPLNVLLAAPRGFCAGVDRAIKIVELALEKYGAPVYVRHEIVHNKFVVDGLKAKGAIFVEELDDIPDNKAPVIFSAHGVPKSVPKEASARDMIFLDATCPLVSKVHREAERHAENGRHILLIGHKGHPEVIGTMGQLAEGQVSLIETLEDIQNLSPEDPDNLAYVTQTTLSVQDTAELIQALQEKFPTITAPNKADICYATTNRQAAVKEIAPQIQALLVLGAPNSSNSNRLVEVAKSHGCAKALLVQRAAELDLEWLKDVETLGVTAGASAPETLVNEVISFLREHFDCTVKEAITAEENVIFHVPKALRQSA